MADDETAAEASANEVAQTAGGVVELYRKSLLVDQVALRHLAVQADQAVATTRAQAISSLARVNLEELAETLRFIDSLHLEGPALGAAMIHLEALSRELSKNLKRFSSETPPTATGDITTATIPVQIYVDETAAGPVVERELRTLLSEVGVVALTGLDPIIGSWYRRLFGTVKDASQTRTAHQLQRAAEIQLIDRYQAGIDGATAGAVSSLIAALANTRGAVIQAGSVLLVKVDDKIIVRQLTPEQLLHWNENPGLFRDPAAALAELQRAMEPSVTSHDTAPFQTQ